jgi:hypothetical protein
MLITKSTKITNSSPEVFSSFPKSEKIFNSTPFKHNLKSVKTKINPENFEVTKSNSRYTTESKLINYWYLERIKEFQRIKLSVKSWEKDFDNYLGNLNLNQIQKIKLEKRTNKKTS